jgi:hypothetical protein
MIIFTKEIPENIPTHEFNMTLVELLQTAVMTTNLN